jgi:UPF0755 protein
VTRRRLLLAVLLLVVRGLAGAGVAAFSLFYPGPALPSPVTLYVAEGERFGTVARALQAHGVVRWALPLVVYARLSGEDRAVRWGEHRFDAPITAVDALRRLAHPAPVLETVTIPEGLTLRQTVARLARAGLGAEESFRCLLDDVRFLDAEGLPPEGAEGYLFPDTYAFPRTMAPERILHTMIAGHRAAFPTDLEKRAAALGMSEQQAVTLASLIEAETPNPDERRLVSAVFHNRLRAGMRLQSDPTVIYHRDSDDRTITRDDLVRPTPHNTYVITGLPPTPIGNPGRASLEAAVDPADVDALYFVARGDGSHEFTASLAEHNRAVGRYRRHLKDAEAAAGRATAGEASPAAE